MFLKWEIHRNDLGGKEKTFTVDALVSTLDITEGLDDDYPGHESQFYSLPSV